MSRSRSARSAPPCALALLVGMATLAAACGRSQPAAPVATPGVTLSHAQAPLGSPLEITYRFIVAAGARFDQDYRVMVHVVDSDQELIWADDHNPPLPTTQWKPGQTVEYTRTLFVPIYPYVGDASIQVGLYSTATQQRLALGGDDAGQHAYTVAALQLLPQSANVRTLFKDGWHPVEVAEQNGSVEWQWTKRSATLAFDNPKKDAMFFLDVDNPGDAFREPQQVQVRLGGTVVGTFTVQPATRVLQKIPMSAAQLGAADMAELQIDVDKTFVPAMLAPAASRDPRELGIRVFHAFVDAR